MAYITLKKKIANLYNELDDLNEHSNHIKNSSLNDLPVSNERLKLYDIMLYQKKNIALKKKDIKSKIREEKKYFLNSKSIINFKIFESENFTYPLKKKEKFNQNFQKKYNELKSFTNNFNNFDESNKENLRRNKSNFFYEIKNYKNYKNGKMLNKKESLKKEIMSELGNGYKINTNGNFNLLRSYSNFFEPKNKKTEFNCIQGVNII